MRSLGATPIRKFSRSVAAFNSGQLLKYKMRFLNFVRIESYVSLVEDNEIEDEEYRTIPTYVFGVDGEGEYLRSKGALTMEENVFVERRIEHSNSASFTILKVECAGQSSSLFIITLNTTHHSFTLNSSCTVRTLSSFYYLHKTLKVGNNKGCPKKKGLED